MYNKSKLIQEMSGIMGIKSFNLFKNSGINFVYEKINSEGEYLIDGVVFKWERKTIIK